MEEIDTSNDDKLNEAKLGWSLNDWVEYYTKDGVMTLNEGMKYLEGLIFKLMREKYGNCTGQPL